MSTSTPATTTSSIHRETLLTLPTSAACVNAIANLHAAFKREFGRNAASELYYSLVFGTDEERLDDPDTHMVTLHAEGLDAVTLAAEVQWFREAALALESR